jgi:uncharacterized membrane protein YeaQ/YmgE (transglycosylase-associated protein family)
MNILYFLLIGLAAGWLAGQIMKGKGFGIIGNMIVGCIGALVGGYVFGLLGFILLWIDRFSYYSFSWSRYTAIPYQFN